MANIANAAFRSRLSRNANQSNGPKGLPHNVGDFSQLSRQSPASRQEFLRKHWDYLPSRLLQQARALSSSYKGVQLDPKDSRQFALGL